MDYPIGATTLILVIVLIGLLIIKERTVAAAPVRVKRKDR